jgi:2-polyprenyl-3-methyl-5-hydroxy-6-metoxy-1,4-benzoquinol methylase
VVIVPYSDDSGRSYVAEILGRLSPSRVLDVGPGAGAYGRLVRQVLTVDVLDAVEAWEPYVERFALLDIYDAVTIEDVRKVTKFDYDLVIFGDVLEHMSRDDAVAVYGLARAQAKAVIVSMPIIHYPQGEEEGNPFEAHVVDHWHHEDILAAFEGLTEFRLFDVTGVYLAA